MASLGERTQVFVIRAWLEPRDLPGGIPEWRFSVEHVGSGDRRHLRDFVDVIRFLEEHLPGMPSDAWWRQLQRLFQSPGGPGAPRRGG